MGVSIQSIVTNMAQGSLQPTGRPYDVAVDGTGYFIIAKGQEGGTITVNPDQSMESTTLESFYTRDGSFKVDSKGNLLNSNGYRIMGYAIGDGTAISPQGGIVNYVDGESPNLNANQNELVPLKIPETVSKLVTDKDGNPEVGADGNPTGRREDVRIQGFSIENDGLIKAVLADGSTTVLGQVAMASFTNNEGLEQKGNNMYSPSANSGNPLARVGKYADKAALGAREDNGKAYGQVLNGFLEMSNVDLSAQFTDMIVATRSFQACGKIITTADEILQELVNLKR